MRDPDATTEIGPNSDAIISSHSGHSIDSLFRSLNSAASNESYGETGDQFNDTKTNIFRAKNDTDGLNDTSILEDDMSISVATSADFSFATQNTNREHYPVQYNPQPLNKDLLDDQPTVLRDTDETEGQVTQTESNSQSIKSKKKKRSNNNKSQRVSNQVFCGVASGVGTALNTAFSSLNSCLAPTDGTGNETPETRDYFSACYRPELDSMSEGDERDVDDSDNNVRGSKNTSHT
mmetsp:Transcript_6119/g.7114  ORF Transcript_6119/g.7114 Transcript_6119/m.7114 type:complete len:235 (+) Transcript_6119:50-754(+)